MSKKVGKLIDRVFAAWLSGMAKQADVTGYIGPWWW